jgi:aryl-alcohol dehydrogenase-like predicted oxidoreductase
VKTRTLGNRGPEVSLVGLGCNNFGMRLDAAETKAVVDAAIDAGVTFFDTADVYGETKSEEYLGQALAGRRDRVVLATKFGLLESPDAPDVPVGSRTYVRWAIEQSLGRLRTDVIDLYQYHRPDGVTPFEETLGEMGALVEEGKVRFIGISNVDTQQVEEAARVANVVSVQNHYSLVYRKPEAEVLPACERLGIGVLPYFPLESGLLTGKVKRGETPAEGRLTSKSTYERFASDEAFDRVERLEQFADARGVSLLEVAIGGLAAMPAVGSVIAGATKPEQVRANARAGEWQPSAADVAALRALP